MPEYAANLPKYCSLVHQPTCSTCAPLLSVAQNVLQNGFERLSQAFKSAFPRVTYHSHSAKRRLLQLPLVALRVWCPESGLSEVYLFEHYPGVNDRQFLHLLKVFQFERSSKKLAMTKQQLKNILSIAQSDREKECIRYTALVTSGLSATGARRHFGFEGNTERVRRVENAIEEAKEICSAIDSIAKLQEKATLAQFGIEVSDDSDSSSSDTDDNDMSLSGNTEGLRRPSAFQEEQMVHVLRAAQFNWFELVSTAEEMGIDPSCLESMYDQLRNCFTQSEQNFCSNRMLHTFTSRLKKRPRNYAKLMH